MESISQSVNIFKHQTISTNKTQTNSIGSFLKTQTFPLVAT